MLKINNLPANRNLTTITTPDSAQNRSTSVSALLIGVHNQPVNLHPCSSAPSVAGHERENVCQVSLPPQFPCNGASGKAIMINEVIRENTLDDAEKEQKLRNRVNNLNLAELFNVAKGNDFRKFTNIIGLSSWDRLITSSKLKLGNNFLLFASGAFWTTSAMLPARDYPMASNHTNLAAGCLAVGSGLLSLGMDSFAKKINSREEREKNRCRFLAELRLYCINNQVSEGKLPSVEDSEESQIWRSGAENIHMSSQLLSQQV